MLALKHGFDIILNRQEGMGKIRRFGELKQRLAKKLE
jgi:hypothetical protein